MIQIIQPKDATFSQVYYLTFICGLIYFERLTAHHQQHTTALGDSGFTIGEKRLGPLLSNGKTRGSQCSCMLLMMGVETLEIY
jgi:hypothetical protein